MKNVPKGWRGKELGELVDFSGGAQPPRSTFIFTPKQGYTRLIQTRDYRTSKYLTFIPSELVRKRCSKEDIMIGRYGPPIFQIFRGLEGAYNVALLKAIPNKNELLNDYLYYFLTQYKVWAFVENLSQRSGGQTGVDLVQLRKYPFPLPPPSEQQKIVDILSAVDEKINLIDQQILETEELKKGLMQRLFSQGIGHTEFKDSQLGKVPKSWVVKRIGEIAKTFAGGTPKRSKPEYFSGGTIPWVKSGEVSSRFIDSTEESVTETALKESSARWIPKDSLLIAMYGATAGQVGILKIPACSNQAVLAVVPSQNKFTIPFLYYYLSEATPDLLKMVQGSGQPNLSKAIVDSLQIPLPPEAEQMEIARILDCISDKLGILSKKKNEYQQLKKALMQQLLTGEIRVNTPIEA